MKQETKTCQNCKENFVIEPEDFEFYEKVKVPPPTFCWICRAQRRFAWRNERLLYKRKCDFSGKEIFSMYVPEADIKSYENSVWYSDEWDPMEYGRDIDFSKPFLSQLLDLFKEVPRPALSVINMVNSDYCNNAGYLKNCYLLFNSNYDEDCFYGNGIDYSKDCFDNSHINKGELVYESFWINRCYRTFFSSQCEDSSDIYLSKNLRGCTNCFGCMNLRNKNYFIFNKPYSKDEYSKKIQEFGLGSFSSLEKLKKEAVESWIHFPNKFMEGVRNTNVSGNYIYNSKNVLNSALVREGENLKYCQYLQIPPNKDCYDHSIWGDNNFFTYECAVCGLGTNNIKFCAESFISLRDLEYCHHCQSSSDLFGCMGLRKKQYCILNKQYSKEEYKKLVPKIIEHMNKMSYEDKKGRVYKYGEFFPAELSPFAYNETIAQEYFPLTKESSEKEGYGWKDTEKRDYKITKKPEDLPDQISDVDDSIINEIIGCQHEGKCNEQCTEAFKIIKLELEFYRKMNLPLPRLCPNCRHYQRINQRNTLKLWNQKCQCAGEKSDNEIYKNTIEHSHHGKDHCPNEFETSYAPDRKEIVYCEKCYQAEVV